MRGFSILLLFNLAGLWLNKVAGLPLPGSVIGLFLFTICLFLGILKLDWVEESAHFLLRHMLLFFAPVVVGAIAVYPLLRQEWISISAGLVGSFLVVLLVTGWVATWLLKDSTETREP